MNRYPEDNQEEELGAAATHQPIGGSGGLPPLPPQQFNHLHVEEGRFDNDDVIVGQQQRNNEDDYNHGGRRSRTSISGRSENIRDSMPENVKKLPLQEQLLTRVDALEEMVISLHARMDVFMEDFYAMFGNRLQQQEGNRQAASARRNDPPQAAHHHHDNNDRDDILNRLEDVIAISAGPSSHNISVEAHHQQHQHHAEEPADAMDDVRATPPHPRDQPQEEVEDVSTWDQTPESVVLSPPTQQNISVMSTTSGGAIENSLMRGVHDGASPQQGIATRSSPSLHRGAPRSQGNAQHTPTRVQLGSSPRRMASTSPLVERFHASQRSSTEETTEGHSIASPQHPIQHHSVSPPRRTPQHKVNDQQISPLQDGAMPIVRTRQPSPNQQYQSPQQQPSGSRSPTRTTPRAPGGAAVDTTQSPNRSARKEQLLSAGLETEERKKEPILFLTSTENRYNARSHGGLVLSERNISGAMNISDTCSFSPLQRQHRQSDVDGSTLHQTVLSDWDVSPVKTTTTTTSASVNIIKEDEDMILEREQHERIRQELNRRGEESHQHRHTNGDQQNTSSSFLADHLLDGAVPVNRHDKKEAETVQVQYTRHSQQQQQQSVSEQGVSRKKSAPEELSSETLLSQFSMISGTIVVRAADEKHTPKGGAKASNGTEVGSPGGEDKRTPPAQVKRRHHHNHHQHPVAPPASDDQQQQQDSNGVFGFNPKFTHSQRDVGGPPESQTQQQGHHLGGLPHNLGPTVAPVPTSSHDTSLGAVQVDSSGSMSPFMSPPTATQRRGMADQAPVAFSRVDGGVVQHDDLGTEEKQPSHHHHHHASQQRTTAAATQSRHKESPGPKLLSPTLSSPADDEHSNGGRSRSRSSSSRQHNNPAETLKPNKRLPTKLSLSRSSQLGNSNKQQPSQLHTAESFARAKRRGSIDAILDESHEMIQKAATPTKSMEGPKQQLGGGGSGVETRKRSKMQLFLQREAASHPDTVASPMKSKAMLQLAANKPRHNHHDVQVPPQGASTPTYEERKKRGPPLPPGSPDTDRTNTTNDGSYLVGAEDQAAPATINEFTGAASVEEPLSTPFATTYNSWEAVETNTEDVQPQTKKDEVQQQQQPHRRDVNGDPSRRKVEENAHHNETTTEQSSLITLPDISPIEKVPAADRYFADEEERNNKGKVEGGGGADSPASPKTSNAAVKRAMDEAAAAAAVDAARSGGTNNEPPVATVKASTAASADHVDLPKRKQPISAPVQMVASTQENVNSSSSYVQERRSTQVFQDTSEFNTGASTKTTTKEKSTNQPSVGATPPAPAPSTPPNMPQRKKKVLPDAFGSPSSTPPPAAEASLTSPGAAPAFDVGGFGTPSKATPVSAAPGGVGATFGSRAAAPTSKTLPSSTASPTTKMSAFDRMFAPKTPPPQQTTAIKPQVDTPSPPQSRHHAHRHHHHHHHGSKYHNFEDGGDTTISATMTNTSDSSSGGGDDDSTSLSFKEDELDDVEIDLDDD